MFFLSLHSQSSICCWGLEWSSLECWGSSLLRMALTIVCVNCGLQVLVFFLLLDCIIPEGRELSSICLCISSRVPPNIYNLHSVNTLLRLVEGTKPVSTFEHIPIPLYNVWSKEHLTDMQNLFSVKLRFRRV